MTFPLVDLISFLQSHGVLDFINAFTTLVLAAFAFVELRRARAAERSSLAAAYGVLTITYVRMWAVAHAWRTETVMKEIRAGVFDPNAIVPAEWGTLIPIIGQLRDRGTIALHLHSHPHLHMMESREIRALSR